MQNENYIEEVLDAVVRNRLPEAQAEFILQEQQVSNVQLEINLHKAAAAAVRKYALQAQIRHIHQEHLLRLGRELQAPITPARVRRMSWKPLLRAAAVLVFLLSGWLTLRITSTSGESLYQEMYQSFALDTERGPGDGAQSEILDRFKAGDYPGVIESFGRLKAPNNREQFLAAYALQSTGGFGRSIGLLRSMLDHNRQSGSVLYQDEAEYYLGLALLRVHEYDAAADIFSKIVQDPGHTYHSRVDWWTLTRLRWLR